MKTVLICPSERPAVGALAGGPLVTLPLLGQSLLEYWLAYIATAGVKQVCLLASEAAQQIQDVAGDGVRWGLDLEVIKESHELTPAQALLKFENTLNPSVGQNGIAVLDHFPGLAQFPLFTSYSDFFTALSAWMPLAFTADRVGLRQLQPGVWVGLRSRISPSARLIAPCWVGSNVWIGPRAVIGPGVILENGAFVEADAEISASHIGANTFVGKFARISNSLACGESLINWKTNSVAQVTDTFLLCALNPTSKRGSRGLISRLAAFCSRSRRAGRASSLSEPPSSTGQADPLEALLHEQTRPI